jgi:hypothetical protein
MPLAKETEMKKRSLKKLNLHRETLYSLEDLGRVVGGAEEDPVNTLDVTRCASNCASCDLD